jgi:hypothetical protein
MNRALARVLALGLALGFGYSSVSLREVCMISPGGGAIVKGCPEPPFATFPGYRRAVKGGGQRREGADVPAPRAGREAWRMGSTYRTASRTFAVTRRR